jgi:glycosyltransferase involved in cell wall biosynthesis
MHIAIYLDSRSFGGIETHIQHLISGLIGRGIDVSLLLHQRYDDHHPLLKQLPAGVSVANINGSYTRLLQYLRAHRPVLHCHGYKAAIIGRLAGLWAGTPVVTTFHNGDPGSGRMAFYNKLDQQTSRLSHNVCVSERIQQQLPSRSTYIPNFIDFPVARVSHALRHQVAFIGRASYEKGPDLYAEITRGLPYDCALYGSGPELNQTLKINPAIKAYGHVDMMAHWDKIRVVVISSRFEGLPLTALEAMARGISVIASTAGDLPKLMASTGAADNMDIGNISGFRRRIHHWMSCSAEEYQNNGALLRRYIRQHHSQSACLPQLIGIYQRLAKHGRAAIAAVETDH